MSDLSSTTCVRAGCFHDKVIHCMDDGSCAADECECKGFTATRETMHSGLLNTDAPKNIPSINVDLVAPSGIYAWDEKLTPKQEAEAAASCRQVPPEIAAVSHSPLTKEQEEQRLYIERTFCGSSGGGKTEPRYIMRSGLNGGKSYHSILKAVEAAMSGQTVLLATAKGLLRIELVNEASK